MARPRNPKGIKPRVKDAMEYNASLRRTFLNPFFNALKQRLATAAAVNEAYGLLEYGLAQWESKPAAGVPKRMIAQALGQVRDFNKAQLFQTFKTALGVDIRPYLNDAAVRPIMEKAIADNVDLIKTIPRRAHTGLKARISEEFFQRPFDQAKLQQLLRDEYQSQGYNLRRLTRDQTQKLNANLVQVRQKQLGVEKYRWQTSEDERVRPTHAFNNKQIFLWAKPPPVTGNPGEDIQCRCMAEPIIEPQNRRRLTQKSEPARGHDILSGKRISAKEIDKMHAEDPQKINEFLSFHGGAYGDLNYRLREGLALNKDNARVLKQLRDHMKPSSINRITYRGVSKFDAEIKPGAVLRFNEPISTSYNPQVAYNFMKRPTEGARNEIIFKLRVPKGQKVVVANPMELETTLDVGSQWRVLADNRKTWYTTPKFGKPKRVTTRVVEVEVMP